MSSLVTVIPCNEVCREREARRVPGVPGLIFAAGLAVGLLAAAAAWAVADGPAPGAVPEVGARAPRGLRGK